MLEDQCDYDGDACQHFVSQDASLGFGFDLGMASTSITAEDGSDSTNESPVSSPLSVAQGVSQDWQFSAVENIDYQKPHSKFDGAFENLKAAAQNLAEHKNGRPYTEKAEDYLRAAMPLVTLIRTDAAARQRLELLASASKVDVRPHAQNRDILILFKLAQKHVGRATTAAERNKWATIAVHGVKEGLDADELIKKVERLGGINNAAKALREPPSDPSEEDGAAEPDPTTVQIKLVVVGLGDDVDLSGFVSAAIAQQVAKRIKAALTAGGAE